MNVYWAETIQWIALMIVIAFAVWVNGKAKPPRR